MLLSQPFKRIVWGQQETKNPQEILNAKMSQVTKNLLLSLKIRSILGNLVSKVQDIYFSLKSDASASSQEANF